MTERRPLSNGVLFVLGLQNLAGQLAGICAPAVTGLIVDGTGAFSAAFAVASGSAVLAMVAWGIVIPQVAPVPWPEVLMPVPGTPSSAQAGAA